MEIKKDKRLAWWKVAERGNVYIYPPPPFFLYVSNKTVGVSYADTTSKQLGVSEFVDNDLFSNLEVKKKKKSTMCKKGKS
jgi:hypothetical protein